jgi:hypothetical protein
MRSGTQPVEGAEVSFMILGFPQFGILSVRSSVGSCTFTADWAECIIGHMPANSEVLVEIELLGDGDFGNEVSVHAGCDRDVEPGNGELRHTIRLVPPGNIFVNGSAPEVRTTVGKNFALPSVFVHALSDAPAAQLTITVPSELSIASAIPDAGECEVSAGTVFCEFGDLLDEVRTVDLNLSATQTGTFTADIQVSAAEDEIPDDNSMSLSVFVDPEPPSPSGNGGSSGGGGGSLDWASLVLAMFGLGLRRRLSGGRSAAKGRYTPADASMDMDDHTGSRCARHAL